MIETKCNHEWKIYNDVGVDSSKPSVYKCKKCATIMTAPEVFQLEALKHLKGFQKWMSIIAICVAVVSLVISILVAVSKQLPPFS